MGWLPEQEVDDRAERSWPLAPVPTHDQAGSTVGNLTEQEAPDRVRIRTGPETGVRNRPSTQVERCTQSQKSRRIRGRDLEPLATGRRRRQPVAHGNGLPLRIDLIGTGDPEIVQPIPAVPTGAIVSHLGGPRPHSIRWRGDGRPQPIDAVT